MRTVSESGYHSSSSCRSAGHIRWPRKSRATLESFSVAVLFRFTDRLALRSDYDDRFRRITFSRHLQKTVVAIVLSRQLNVERVSIWKNSDWPRDKNDVLSKARH